MCVWDETSGKITLAEGQILRANIPRKRLQATLETVAGAPCTMDDPQRATMLATRAFPFCSNEAACLCLMSQGRLRTVELQLVNGTAAQQRETFFSFIGRQDPCPQTQQGVLLRYPFGTVWIATDVRSGYALLRITYASRSDEDARQDNSDR